MTEAMPFLQKAILLSYAPRSLPGDIYYRKNYRGLGSLLTRKLAVSTSHPWAK